MARISVEHTVKGVISKTLQIDPASVSDEAHIMDDLGADSLEMIEIQMALEDAFGIAIPDDEAERLQIVGNAVQWIEDHLV